MPPHSFSTPFATSTDTNADANAHLLAADWRAHLASLTDSLLSPPEHSTSDLSENHRAHSTLALAEFAATCLLHRETALLVVPDDEWLPEISNALDIELRPLCLVLPEADFAAATTLRATLSLLKSRLSREAPAEYAACQEAQRIRLDEKAPLWKSALDWSAAGFFSGPWPGGIEDLFPVLILPVAQAMALPPSTQSLRDILLVLHAERMPKSAVMQLKSSAHRGLLLRDLRACAPHQITPVDTHRRLRLELDLLVQELGDMELEFATAQAELAEFTRRYHEIMAHRLIELDHLQAQIARILAHRAPAHAELQQHAKRARTRAEQSRQEHQRYTELDIGREKPFTPSRHLKRLFRQLAQKIHPDRAENEEDRTWRTELMSEANRAYRNADEMVLRDILEQWQTGRPDRPEDATTQTRPHSPHPATPTSSGQEANAVALQREIQRVQQRIARTSEQLNRLIASKLYELFTATALARRRERDLLKEMADQIDLQIEAARAQLAQLEPMSDA